MVTYRSPFSQPDIQRQLEQLALVDDMRRADSAARIAPTSRTVNPPIAPSRSDDGLMAAFGGPTISGLSQTLASSAPDTGGAGDFAKGVAGAAGRAIGRGISEGFKALNVSSRGAVTAVEELARFLPDWAEKGIEAASTGGNVGVGQPGFLSMVDESRPQTLSIRDRVLGAYADEPIDYSYRDVIGKYGEGKYGAVVGFAGDVAFDPLTYVTAGAMKFTGSAGRTSLATRLGQSDVLAAVPSVGEKLDKIVRYGEVALTRAERSQLVNMGILEPAGMRLAGVTLPRTEPLARGVQRTLSGARAVTGDVLAKIPTGRGRNFLTMFTPKSMRSFEPYFRGQGTAKELYGRLIADNIGRHGTGAGMQWVEETANLYADVFRQLENEAGSETVNAARQLVESVDANGNFIPLPNMSKELYDAAVPLAQQVADMNRNILISLNRQLSDYAKKNGLRNIRPINNLDDFLHHSLTPEASNMVAEARKANAKWYQKLSGDGTFEEVSFIEFAAGPGATRARKYTAGQEFLGQELKTGSIDEINKIWREELGVDFDFFKTDLYSIQASYVQSMGKQYARVAAVDQLFKYPTQFRVVLDDMFPDPALKTAAKDAYNGYQDALNNILVGFLDDSAKPLQEAVKGTIDTGIAGTRNVKKELEKSLKELERLQKRLDSAEAKANKVAGDTRDEWVAAHSVITAKIETLMAAIESGEAAQLAAIEWLIQKHAALHPNVTNQAEMDLDVIIKQIDAAIKAQPSPKVAKTTPKKAPKGRVAKPKKAPAAKGGAKGKPKTAPVPRVVNADEIKEARKAVRILKSKRTKLQNRMNAATKGGSQAVKDEVEAARQAAQAVPVEPKSGGRVSAGPTGQAVTAQGAKDVSKEGAAPLTKEEVKLFKRIQKELRSGRSTAEVKENLFNDPALQELGSRQNEPWAWKRKVEKLINDVEEAESAVGYSRTRFNQLADEVKAIDDALDMLADQIQKLELQASSTSASPYFPGGYAVFVTDASGSTVIYNSMDEIPGNITGADISIGFAPELDNILDITIPEEWVIVRDSLQENIDNYINEIGGQTAEQYNTLRMLSSDPEMLQQELLRVDKASSGVWDSTDQIIKANGEEVPEGISDEVAEWLDNTLGKLYDFGTISSFDDEIAKKFKWYARFMSTGPTYERGISEGLQFLAKSPNNETIWMQLEQVAHRVLTGERLPLPREGELNPFTSLPWNQTSSNGGQVYSDGVKAMFGAMNLINDIDEITDATWETISKVMAGVLKDIDEERGASLVTEQEYINEVRRLFAAGEPAEGSEPLFTSFPDVFNESVSGSSVFHHDSTLDRDYLLQPGTKEFKDAMEIMNAGNDPVARITDPTTEPSVNAEVKLAAARMEQETMRGQLGEATKAVEAERRNLESLEQDLSLAREDFLKKIDPTSSKDVKVARAERLAQKRKEMLTDTGRAGPGQQFEMIPIGGERGVEIANKLGNVTSKYVDADRMTSIVNAINSDSVDVLRKLNPSSAEIINMLVGTDLKMASRNMNKYLLGKLKELHVYLADVIDNEPSIVGDLVKLKKDPDVQALVRNTIAFKEGNVPEPLIKAFGEAAPIDTTKVLPTPKATVEPTPKGKPATAKPKSAAPSVSAEAKELADLNKKIAAAEKELADLEALAASPQAASQPAAKGKPAPKGKPEPTPKATTTRKISEKQKQLAEFRKQRDVALKKVKITDEVTLKGAPGRLRRYENELLREMRDLEKAIYNSKAAKNFRSAKDAHIAMLAEVDKLKLLAADQDKWEADVRPVLEKFIKDFVDATKDGSKVSAEQTQEWFDNVNKVLKSVDRMNLDPDLTYMLNKVIMDLKVSEANAGGAAAKVIDSKFVLDEVTAKELAKRQGVEALKAAGFMNIWNLGVSVPEEIIGPMFGRIAELTTDEGASKFAKFMMDLNKPFKAWALATPGFGVRNAMTAAWNNWVGGTTARHNNLGLKFAEAFAETVETFGGKTDRMFGSFDDAFELGMSRGWWTADDRDVLQTAYRGYLIAGGGQAADDLMPFTSTAASRALESKLRKAGRIVGGDNAYVRYLRQKNQLIEMAARMPLGIMAAEQGMDANGARALIARWHFDYTDLSSVDQAMRPIVVFWLFASRNIPTQLMGMISNPKPYLIYEKLRNAMPDDSETTPWWLARRDPLALGDDWILNPDLPHVDMVQQLQDIGTLRGLAAQSTPYLRVPYEMATGRNVQYDYRYRNDQGLPAGAGDYPAALLGELINMVSGGRSPAGFADGGVTEFTQSLAGQLLPAVGTAQRLGTGLGLQPVLGGPQRYQERNPLNPWLGFTGVPAYNVSEQEKQKQRERNMRALEELKKQMGL